MLYAVERLSGRVTAAVACATAAIVTTVCHALAAAEPSQTAAEIARNLGLQQNLPIDSSPPVSAPWFGSLDFLGADFFRLVLFAAIAAGIIFALWTIRDRLPALGRRKLTAKEAAGLAGNASLEQMAVAQMEADELARQGHIVEAMHALLLRSLTELRKRLNVSFADSLTSREILKNLALSETGKASLADIIQRVEFVYFGDRRADEGDYAACRESYLRLTQAMQAGFAAEPAS